MATSFPGSPGTQDRRVDLPPRRYLRDRIAEDLRSKLVFIGGPRQLGKTSLARSLLPSAGCRAQRRRAQAPRRFTRARGDRIARIGDRSRPVGAARHDTALARGQSAVVGLRAVRKERKHDHDDWTTVIDPAARFENLVASHLLEWVEHQSDTEGRDLELRCFRDIDGREVDFVVTERMQPIAFVERKTSDAAVGTGLRYLRRRFPTVTS